MLFRLSISRFPPKKFCNIRPWWWSSGQRGCLQLQQSKFKPRLSLQFLFCKLSEKDENKQKEAEHLLWVHQCRRWMGEGGCTIQRRIRRRRTRRRSGRGTRWCSTKQTSTPSYNLLLLRLYFSLSLKSRYFLKLLCKNMFLDEI